MMRQEREGERYLYQAWYNDGSEHGFPYCDFESAHQEALENNGDEVEQLVWYNRDDYNDGKEADEWNIVWKRGE
jgi:isopentenyldiphosphate isomerase